MGWGTCSEPTGRVFEQPGDETLERLRLGLAPGKPDREFDGIGHEMEREKKHKKE